MSLSSFLTWSNSLVPDLIRLTGSDLIQLFVSDSIRLFVSALIRPIASDSIHLTVFDRVRLSFSVRFASHLTDLSLIWVTSFESHSSQASGSPTLARMSSKQFNIEIVEYSTILRTQIGIGEDTLKFEKFREEKQSFFKSDPSWSSGNLIQWQPSVEAREIK